MKISSTQKKQLRKLSHHLQPVVLIGQSGYTEAVRNEIEVALISHELIKVRISGADRDSRQRIVSDISTETDSALIQQIGHTAVFYRANPEKKSGRIELKK